MPAVVATFLAARVDLWIQSTHHYQWIEVNGTESQQRNQRMRRAGHREGKPKNVITLIHTPMYVLCGSSYLAIVMCVTGEHSQRATRLRISGEINVMYVLLLL